MAPSQRGRARRSDDAGGARNGSAVEPGPRTPKGFKTRARLLEGARAVFERDGFLDARIADIAVESGLSHGAFYHYFSSKEQIFREVAEQQEVSLLTLNSSEGSTPLERIRAANRDYLTAYIAASKIMRVIEEVSRYDDQVHAVRAERDREFGERLQSSIARLQEQGAADPRIDPAYAADALGCMVSRFAELFVRQGHFELEPAVEQLTLLWGNAIGLRVSD